MTSHQSGEGRGADVGKRGSGIKGRLGSAVESCKGVCGNAFPKLWAVGKLSKDHLVVGKLLSKNAKFEAGDIWRQNYNFEHLCRKLVHVAVRLNFVGYLQLSSLPTFFTDDVRQWESDNRGQGTYRKGHIGRANDRINSRTLTAYLPATATRPTNASACSHVKAYVWKNERLNSWTEYWEEPQLARRQNLCRGVGLTNYDGKRPNPCPLKQGFSLLYDTFTTWWYGTVSWPHNFTVVQ